MPNKKIKDGLYSVGILNPNMRVFDIVMKTEWGTSYNSYIVKAEKTALIETCHHRFFKEYSQNISEVTDPDGIDYIILNHTEPDHSGALERLVKLCRHAEIVCSRAASIYLKAITNDPERAFKVVKDGDTLSLGSIDLKFVSAPFLHWPDTMFTYAPQLKTVFTCDFLGAHFCEPNMIDSDISYPEKYKSALKGYYDDIFSPFTRYVRDGLVKLKGLDFDTVCVSHGPILTNKTFLGYALKSYAEWSAEQPKTTLNLPVFYCSAYGYTRKLADAAVEEIKAAFKDADTAAYDIIENDVDALADILNESDGFMIGSPTLNRDAVRPVWELLARLDAINSQKKPAAVFGSYGWSGEAVSAVTARLNAVNIRTTGDGFKINFNPSAAELLEMKKFTASFLDNFKK